MKLRILNKRIVRAIADGLVVIGMILFVSMIALVMAPFALLFKIYNTLLDKILGIKNVDSDVDEER